MSDENFGYEPRYGRDVDNSSVTDSYYPDEGSNISTPVIDPQSYTIKELFPMVDREEPEKITTAALGWLSMSTQLSTLASSITRSGETLQGVWDSEAADVFLGKVGSVTYSLREWQDVATDNYTALNTLAGAVEQLQTKAQEIWDRFTTEQARLQEDDDNGGLFGFEPIEDVTDVVGGHRQNDSLKVFTEEFIRDVTTPMATAFSEAGRVITSAPMYRGSTKDIEVPALNPKGPTAPGRPGAPAQPGRPALPSMPSMPNMPTTPNPTQVGILVTPTIPTLPNYETQIQSQPVLDIDTTLPQLPSLDGLSTDGTVPTLIAPSLAGFKAQGAGITGPAAPATPAMPAMPTMPAVGTNGLGGRMAAPGLSTPSLAAGTRGIGGTPGAQMPMLPGRGAGVRKTKKTPGGGGLPMLPGRGGLNKNRKKHKDDNPGIPALPGRGANGTKKRRDRDGTGMPIVPGIPGALRRRDRDRDGMPGMPGVPGGLRRQNEDSRTTAPNTGVGDLEIPGTGGLNLTGRFTPGVGAPETVQSARSAMRRGMEGRGLRQFPGAGNKPNSMIGAPRQRRKSEEDDEFQTEGYVGDQELFDVDQGNDGVIERSPDSGPEKRSGPALGSPAV